MKIQLKDKKREKSINSKIAEYEKISILIDSEIEKYIQKNITIISNDTISKNNKKVCWDIMENTINQYFKKINTWRMHSQLSQSSLKQQLKDWVDIKTDFESTDDIIKSMQKQSQAFFNFTVNDVARSELFFGPESPMKNM